MTAIAVSADGDGLPPTLRPGVLHAQRSAGRNIFEFAFDASALAYRAVAELQFDPRMGLFEGHQHPPQGHATFRVGALRLRPDGVGDLLDKRHGVAAPPMVQLRALERDEDDRRRTAPNAVLEDEQWWCSLRLVRKYAPVWCFKG